MASYTPTVDIDGTEAAAVQQEITKTPAPTAEIAVVAPALTAEAPALTAEVIVAAPESGAVFVTKWGAEGTGNGQFDWPAGIGVAPDGGVYVADRGNSRIQKFTSEGEFITDWGAEGTSDGQFSRPTGIAVASDGSVYVADTNNNRIQKFLVGP